MNPKQKTIRSHQKVVKNGKNASYLEVFLTQNMTSKEKGTSNESLKKERENPEIISNKS